MRAQGAIPAACEQCFAIRGNCHSRDPISLTVDTEIILAQPHVPECADPVRSAGEEMLAILREKMRAEGLLSRIRTHQCKPDSINLPAELNGSFDVAFTIFVVHEVPDPAKLFREIAMLLKPGGRLFYTEPPFIVSGKEYQENLALAEEAGFLLVDRSFFFVNRAAGLKKG